MLALDVSGYDLAALLVLVLGVLAALLIVTFVVARGRRVGLRVGVFVERERIDTPEAVDGEITQEWPRPG